MCIEHSMSERMFTCQEKLFLPGHADFSLSEDRWELLHHVPNFTVILQFFYRTFMTRPSAPVYTLRGRPGTASAPGHNTGISQPFCSSRSGTPCPRLVCFPCPAYTGPGSGGPPSLSVCLLRVVHPPPGEPYADQSCRRNCIPASRSHGGHTVAGQSAGLQSLLARDYPPEFWAGLRRGPGALPRPL